MKSVWLVEEGAYSDYRVVAIFENEAEAKIFCNGNEDETHAGYSGPYIREVELGTPKESPGIYQKKWCIFINIETGNMESSRVEIAIHPLRYSSARRNGGDRATSIYAESAVSEQHAVKIAAECRQNVLRERSVGMV